MHEVESTRSRLAPVLALLVGVALVGCDALDDLLDVAAPSRVIAEDLDDPDRAVLLAESVRNEFRCAFAHYVNVSGMVGWEWTSVTNGGTRPFYDSRQWSSGGYPSQAYAGADCGGGNTAHYITLSRSRWFADEILRRLDEWGTELVPEKVELESEVSAWAGYSYVFFGESMCSVAFDEGPEHAPEHALELAVERFDRSMAAGQAAGRTDVVNLARVGKGRALLELGRTAEAAAAVAEVPEGFSFEMRYSSLSDATRNRPYRENYHAQAVGVGDPYKNMEFEGVSDPRVPVRDEETTIAGYDVPYWTQQKYTSFDDPIRLASWEEARLITAEAAVEDGRLDEAVAILNDFHAGAGLPEFASDDPDEVMEVLVYNRRAELFLESHHLADLNRYELPLHPPAGEAHVSGAIYGDQRCFPLPDREVFNNPNI